MRHQPGRFVRIVLPVAATLAAVFAVPNREWIGPGRRH